MWGGAIWNGGTLNATDCAFTGNQGDWGGAINNIGTCTFTGCTFTGNTANIGGAIYGININVKGCTFTGNTATHNSGAIHNSWGICNVSDSTFNGNTANIDGGAIWNDGTLNVTDCDFKGNQGDRGGAIYNYLHGTCTVTGSTFTDNHATNGGAINSEGTCTVHFNRFYNNTATTGNAICSIGQSNAENNWWGTNNPNLNWNNYTSGFPAPVWWIYMNLTANPPNPLYGDMVNLTANFNYHSNGTDITPLTGDHIPDSEVSFASNDGSLNPSSKNTMNGLASLIFTPNHLGSVTVNATLDNQVCTLIFNVGKGVPSVSVDSVHNFAGQTVNLTANIVDQNGNPVNQGEVTFKVGNAAEITVTVLNGIARIDNWTIPANWNTGNYTILVNYLENSNYTASSGTGNLTVTKTPTSITAQNAHNFAGQIVTLTANVKDYYNQPINSGNVVFTVNGVTVVKSVVDGVASIDWTIPNWDVGIYDISAIFNGTGTNYDNSFDSSTLTVDQTPTNLTVSNATSFWHQYVNIVANLTDYYGNPINSQTISFTIAGDPNTYTAITVNGLATLNYHIIQNIGNYNIHSTFAGNEKYLSATTNPNGTLTVTKTPTNITTNNATGNKGKTVTLNATLKDYYGTPLNNRTVEFYINNVKVGENTTDTNGLTTFNYNITQIGGICNITAKFLGDFGYMASTGNGTLKVNHSSVYVNVTASKTNPTIGETITLTFKLGNNGPDPADDVVFTYVIPEGMEFVSIETEPGYPQATYNATTRTITWPLGTVPKLDPWIKLNVLVLNSGAFNINPTVTTITYDPTLGNDIQQITINAVQAASATSTTRTIGMQETGIPINYLILAILAIISGLVTSKKS